jgi:homoaconitase/3-isopropylmalate dehydratase large subunit
MGLNVAQKLIESHLLSGEMTAGKEIGIRIDQTLTQDATGTLVMLELESMGLDSARTELSCQYVDHNLIQEDHKNPDDRCCNSYRPHPVWSDNTPSDNFASGDARCRFQLIRRLAWH